MQHNSDKISIMMCSCHILDFTPLMIWCVEIYVGFGFFVVDLYFVLQTQQ